MVWNSQFFRDGKASHSPCIWMSARHGLAAAENFGQRGCCRCEEKLVKEQKGAWRRRIYRKYASCKWLKDAGLEFTRADVVVSISRGPPGQWFPETEHWASAIFVGTSGIPPKIIYRSVKSYPFYSLSRLSYSSLPIWVFVSIEMIRMFGLTDGSP